MTQDRESGAAAAHFGHKAAAAIGAKIGATKLSSRSKEFELNGKRVTIRTARKKTNDFGVLYAMLDRVESVIAAYETAPDEFELRSISPEVFREEMRDSPTGKGCVGLVQKKVFVERGTFVAKVNIAI